ncbi:mesenchyme-specific cell surface glycoprotein-like [Saccoglossus kowalevskii]
MFYISDVYPNHGGRVVTVTVSISCVVVLKPISTLYLPYVYVDDQPLYAPGNDVAEQLAHDPKDHLVYVVGTHVIHILDVSDADNPYIVYHSNITQGVATDIELCGDYVGMSVVAVPKTSPGTVLIFDRYDGTGIWNPIHEITVGALPDMLHFTKDCTTIVVANEGEPGESELEEGTYVDPEGSVTIITFPSKDLSQTPQITTADFTTFNDRADQYVSNGVRAPMMGQVPQISSGFSQNMEPEYVAFNEDDSIAYIALQERINIQSWPILGMYQPDGLIYIHIDDAGYLVMANEGDSMEIEFEDDSWDESITGHVFVQDDLLSTTVSDRIAHALANDSMLGRLGFSMVDGKSASNSTKYDTFYSYGGRSFSIIRTSDMHSVFDSGSELESIHAEVYPSIFNMNGKFSNLEETPEDLIDSRSDNKGPEPESLAYGKVGSKDILFIGNERMNTIMLYSVTGGGGILSVAFESIYRAGGLDDTFDNLYGERNLGDYDPEDMRFVDGPVSPNGRPMLLVAATVSGTVSLYEVLEEVNQDMKFILNFISIPLSQKLSFVFGLGLSVYFSEPKVWVLLHGIFHILQYNELIEGSM